MVIFELLDVYKMLIIFYFYLIKLFKYLNLVINHKIFFFEIILISFLD
jgi:hypothetical protein